MREVTCGEQMPPNCRWTLVIPAKAFFLSPTSPPPHFFLKRKRIEKGVQHREHSKDTKTLTPAGQELLKNNQRRQSRGRVGSHVPEATFRTAHLYARNLSLRLLYCDLMIKPNKTKTWPSGAAFNISESAAGIQLFSVWIHFPFINISVCINKMKVALQNQREVALLLRGRLVGSGSVWPVFSHASF